MSYRILAVDDEPSIRKAIAMGLAPKGFEVDLAADGAAALALGGRSRYDVMIIDLRLPDIHGLDVVRRLKDLQPDLVSIVITGSADLESSIAAIDLEVGGYIQKPLSVQAVIDALDRALARRERLQQQVQVRLDRLVSEGKRQALPATGKDCGARPCGLETVPMLLHQIRNPLSAILGSAELALFELHDPAALRDYLENIITATEKIDQINTAFMDCGKAGASRREALPLRPILEDAVRMFRHLLRFKGIRLDADLEAADARVDGDRFELEQVFKNLLLNAVQAMEDAAEKRLRVTTCRHDGRKPRIEVVVADTGCGIAPGDLDHVFEARFSTKTNGSGIGLPVVEQLLRNMGGRITLNSEPGAGTAFTVSLPLSL